MADKFTFGSAGEIQEVEFALARNGWTHALLKKATGGDFFGYVREVLEGKAEICRVQRLTAEVAPAHMIDCDADPFVPDGWEVLPDDEQLPNRVRGAFKWNAANVALHLDKDQKNGKCIDGNKLRQTLSGKQVLNANVLDYLLANTHLIPEEWKGKFVFFWGTIYRGRDGSLFVRCLSWSGDGWGWGAYWLGDGWGGNDPAAVPAS